LRKVAESDVLDVVVKWMLCPSHFHFINGGH
jgi:hypothetical protein